jgi:hypothetical protein
MHHATEDQSRKVREKMTEQPSKDTTDTRGVSEQEELFDVLIPPGVPRRIIKEVLEKYDVELVERKQRLYFANMAGDERELLAFRGKREEVEKVEKYMFDELKEYINE